MTKKTRDPLAPPRADLERLRAGTLADPHRVLGAHATDGGVVIRAWLPGARAASAHLPNGTTLALEPLPPGGLFAGIAPGARPPLDYEVEVEWPGARTRSADPYSLLPSLGDLDLHLIGQGSHWELGRTLGAHVRDHQGLAGTSFSVWAPGAAGVSVVGDFNGWNRGRHPMRSLGATGVWELFVPAVGRGERYKFHVVGADGIGREKADPVGGGAEVPPNTASVTTRSTHEWADQDWLAQRDLARPHREPVSIYEVHLPSWRRVPEEGDRPLTYREAGDALVEYATEMGFTHVELLPVMAHPFSGSWGYQVTSYFAPAPSQGDADDLRAMIDTLHAAGIGVILDWVPAHFPKDEFALARFDGTALYEHADPRRGEHPDWGTLVFNFGRTEVRNFLIASAEHWIGEYHVDGIRVDAVASMLYRDYSREAGEWVPNERGGNEDEDAIAFLRELNEVVHARHGGLITAAEESTAWPNVSRPTSTGGLGFDLKWNMGWMHDTLRYFAKDPVHRKHHHDELTFSLVYAFSEQYVLPLSHDEVVHGKGSLINKMPGDEWQQTANLRALYGYMWAHPGKKLLFMGGEIGQTNEWNHESSVDWGLLEYGRHEGIRRLVRDLNHAYRTQPALWERDSTPDGFAWMLADAAEDNLIAFARFPDDGSPLVSVSNLSPVAREGYRVPLPRAGSWREILNTDAASYWGSDVDNGGSVEADAGPERDQPASALLTLPPLATVWLIPDE